MSVVELRDVTFSYGGRPVVDGVSLDVAEGAFLGFVGPNGSGKTTLLELMVGLHRPDSGSVTLFDRPAHAFAEADRVGYVPQNVAAADTEMPATVREVVRMGRYPHKLFGRFDRSDRRAVDAALDRVGIRTLEDRRIGRLSGGQRQRAFIARALAAEADLLVLDEPTVGVDAESRDAFYDLLHELNDEGLTVVLVEHDIGTVTTHASEIACLNRRLYFHGDPEGFVETGALAEAYGSAQHVVHHDHR